MYPIDKYKYFRAGNKIIAVSTYAGKTVRGVAICDEDDTFSLDKGKKLAAARCAAKIAEKRFDRSAGKLMEAEDKLFQAQGYLSKMKNYYNDAWDAVDEARSNLNDVLKGM